MTQFSLSHFVHARFTYRTVMLSLRSLTMGEMSRESAFLWQKGLGVENIRSMQQELEPENMPVCALHVYQDKHPTPGQSLVSEVLRDKRSDITKSG